MNKILHTNSSSSTHHCKAAFFINANSSWITSKADGTQTFYILYTNNGGTTWSWQGSYEVSLNGIQMTSGVYFYTMQTENFMQTKIMILQI